MASLNRARMSLLIVGALGGCACSGVAAEEATGKPAADTYAAGAQAEPKCAASHEQLIDLGSFGADPTLGYSIGMALNERGTVVGYSTAAGGQTHPFRWKAETGMVDLDALNETGSVALAVNEQDEVVGYRLTSDGYVQAVMWDAENVAHELGTLGGPNSYALRINNRGQVIGQADDDTFQSFPFIWDAKTGMKKIDLPGPYFVTLGSINDSGTVVGTWIAPRQVVAFKWTKQDGVTELDRLGGTYGEAFDINNQGEIAGHLLLGYDSIGVKWTACDVVRLPRIPDGTDTRPQAINDRGAMVGADQTSSFTAVQWDPMLRVSVLPLGASSSRAQDLNNCGDVTGVRTVAGVSHAYLWHPERPEQ